MITLLRWSAPGPSRAFKNIVLGSGCGLPSSIKLGYLGEKRGTQRIQVQLAELDPVDHRVKL